MKICPALLTRASLLWLATLPAAVQAQTTTATTNPVGYLQTQCLGNSDTLVALPFTRMPAFTGAVASVSGSTLSIGNTPGFTANQFVAGTGANTDTFYLTVGPATAALTGTITVTQGSAAVAGAGTAFNTQLAVGDRLTFNDGYNTLTFTVAGIADANNLTLDRAYGDAAAPAFVAAAPSVVKAPVALAPALPVRGKAGRFNFAPTTTGLQPAAVAPAVVKPAASGSSFSGLAATYDHSLLEGRWYLVSANDASSVTVTLNGDSLSTLAAGTQVSLIPCWTLSTLYPATDAGVSFTASTSLLQLSTQILIPNYRSKSINISTAATYFFYDNGATAAWRLFGDDSSVNHGNDVILPDGYFTVRQDNGSPTVMLTLNGAVPVNKLVTPIASNTKQYQDNAIGLNRPADVQLNALGLNVADGSLAPTTSVLDVQDQLLSYKNTKVSFNKSAAATYFYYNGGWRLFGDDPAVDHGLDVISASSALTLRKAPTSGQTVFWQNSPNY